MPNTSHHKEDPTTEQLRLMLAIAIIATAIGVFTLDSERHVFALILQGFVALPGFMLGLYVLFTAAHLKYNDPAEIGVLSITEKARRGCYDQGINLFWTMLLIYVLIFSASTAGWDGDMSKILDFWPSLVISAFVLLVLMLITAFMAEKEKQTPKTEKKRARKLFRRKK